jgi:hypothetical protein
MKQSAAVEAPDQYLKSVRTVGSKTFILKAGVWTDTEYDLRLNIEKVQVRFGSPEFFELLTKHPKLAQYFALGQKVVVVFEGKAFQVVD